MEMSGRSWHVTALYLTTTAWTTIAVMAYLHTTFGAVGSSSMKASTLPPIASTESGRISRGEVDAFDAPRMDVEKALDVIEAASTGSMGEDCVTMTGYKSLPAGGALDPLRYNIARQKTDMAAMMLQNLGSTRHTSLLDAVAKSLLLSVRNAVGTRVIVFNASTETVIAATWITRTPRSMGETTKIENDAIQPDARPDSSLPWFKSASGRNLQLRSPKFVQSAPIESYMGWWTLPYLSCNNFQWLISYSVYVRPSDTRRGIRDFLSIEIDISDLEVNQCDNDAFASNNSGSEASATSLDNQIATFRGSHKCHNDTTQSTDKKRKLKKLITIALAAEAIEEEEELEKELK